MPHASVKLIPGVDQNETPALNTTGISTCNLIRFIPDRNGIGLIQKLGGWIKYYLGSTGIPAIIRNLWAWEDTNAVRRLAFGTENESGRSILGVIDGSNPSLNYTDITPKSLTNQIPPQASTTSGSSLVVITDTTVGPITQYDSVYIATHISVGGIVLFGLYPCNPNVVIFNSTQYYVEALTILGNPNYATSTSSSASIAQFTTTAGAVAVNVLLPNHGYSQGSTYPILVQTDISDGIGSPIYLYGNYIVQSVVNQNNFVINSIVQSPASANVYIGNTDKAYLIYSFGKGAEAFYSGYGLGHYGFGKYGYGETLNPASGDPISANDWTMDNWGQILISCPINPPPTGTPQFQPIYQWDPTSNASEATIIPFAPPVNDGVFVAMPQRQIIAWGSTETGVQDPLLVRWCDVNNFYSWIPLVTNQAGSYRIPKGSKIVGAIQGPQQGIIWTDIDCWSMQYIGPPYVYSFNEIGTGCGLIARKAAASVNGVVYWMGPSQFFSLTGSGIQPVFCPVWDVIFQDLDTSNLDKIRVAVNSRFGEITWYYPTLSNSGEINAYVKFNVVLQQWDFGNLARSAWVDQSVLGAPIGSDPNTLQLYQHESNNGNYLFNADTSPMVSSFQTGYFALNEADLKTFIDQVWPDMKWGLYGGDQNATVNLTFYATDYAGQTPIAYGPYPMTVNTTFLTPRIRGRLVSIKLESEDLNSFWRIGNIRYRFQQDGKF
jgi:hypothetical protein